MIIGKLDSINLILTKFNKHHLTSHRSFKIILKNGSKGRSIIKVMNKINEFFD